LDRRARARDEFGGFGLRRRGGPESTSASVAKAQKAGLRVLPVRQAAEEAEIVMILVPDELAPGVYESEVAPAMKAGKYLAFRTDSGFISGSSSRRRTSMFHGCAEGARTSGAASVLTGRGRAVPAGDSSDPSGDTKKIGLAYASGIGGRELGSSRRTSAKKRRRICSASSRSCAADLRR